MIDWVVAGAVVVGAFFVLVGSIGLVRFGDFFARLHAPTKATTLGLGALLAGSMVHFGFALGQPSLRELLIAVFLFMSAPVSAHLMAKAALHLRGRPEATRKYEP